MSLLLIALPPGPPADYAFATSADGQDVATHGSAAPALLPAAGRAVEVVAVVPAARLSWQRVRLPRGIGARSPRLRAVLAGLLEARGEMPDDLSPGDDYSERPSQPPPEKPIRPRRKL